MIPETIHILIFIIDSFFTQASIYGSDPWSKINVYRFLQYVLLDQVSKVWASYYTANQYPTLILDLEEWGEPPHDAPQDRTMDDFFGFSWQTSKICTEYMENVEVINKGEVNEKRVIKGTDVPKNISSTSRIMFPTCMITKVVSPLIFLNIWMLIYHKVGFNCSNLPQVMF